MLYTVAEPGWSPGRPLTPSVAPGGFFRRRDAAERIAAGRPLLAAAIRYDATRGRVVAHGCVPHTEGGTWGAPATMNDLGAVTVLAPVPSSLLREVGPAEIRVHPKPLRLIPPPHGRGRLARRLLDPEHHGGEQTPDKERDHPDPGPARRVLRGLFGAGDAAAQRPERRSSPSASRMKQRPPPRLLGGMFS